MILETPSELWPVQSKYGRPSPAGSSALWRQLTAWTACDAAM